MVVVFGPFCRRLQRSCPLAALVPAVECWALLQRPDWGSSVSRRCCPVRTIEGARHRGSKGRSGRWYGGDLGRFWTEQGGLGSESSRGDGEA